IIRGGAGRGEPRDILRPDPPPVAQGLVLAVGKPAALPTHYAGAVRIRALPSDTRVTGQEKKEGEILFALEAKAGPRLAWKRAVGLRIHRARDARGQLLEPVPMLFELEKPQEIGRGRTRVVVN